MEQQINFHMLDTADNKLSFVCDGITITTGKCDYENGKHLMADPSSAVASFKCCGTVYNVANTEGALTIEDWYADELLVKREMMDMLIGIPS